MNKKNKKAKEIKEEDLKKVSGGRKLSNPSNPLENVQGKDKRFWGGPGEGTGG